MTRSIGFIGLGVMGRPMAAHLTAAGAKVAVHNRSSAAVDDLVSKGAVRAQNPAEVARHADVIITMLPDLPDVENVLFDSDGVLSTARRGALVIDCSTVTSDGATSIAARLGEHGVRFVDAPVSGGETGAVNGTLAVMMGGEAESVAEAARVVEPFASVTAHVGPTGSGQFVKAANQMIVAGNLAMVAEALTLLQRTPVDIDAAVRVLNSGLAASRVLENKAAKMINHEFTPGFRIDLHHKDLQIALGAAETANVAVPVTAHVTQLVQALRSAGDGGLDHAALVRSIERLSAIGEPGNVSVV